MNTLMESLNTPFLGHATWLWLMFMSIVVVLLALDLGVLHRKEREIGIRESLWLSGGYISVALIFGAWVWWHLGAQSGMEYLTGFVIEKSLSMDNVFVIALIFGYFAVPREYQHRVLFWGIIGAIVFRAIFISAGAAVVNSWTWILYIFAAFLIFTGWKMLRGHGQEMKLEGNAFLAFVRRRIRVSDTIENHNFFVRRPHPSTGKLVLFATPLFLALIMVEAADIVFAVDSVPAIFAVTRDPFIVYTSNIFAILGLRSMYFMLAAAVERFKYLKYGLSLVLILIGVKIVWNFGLAKELGWVPYLEPHWSLVITLGLLGGSIAYSLWRTRGANQREKQA